MNIYFISGLGADKRVFQKLILPNHLNPVYLDWLTPQPKESLAAYAGRMAAFIDIGKPFYLVGVSFGGMIATEIAKQISPQRTILLSSLSTSARLPWYYRFSGRLHIDKIIPAYLLTSANPFTYWLFGAKDRATQLLLKQILKETDRKFLKWAIRAIIDWHNQTEPTNLIHIHGTADKILPVRFVDPDLTVLHGGHLMIYNRSDEINKLIPVLLKADTH